MCVCWCVCVLDNRHRKSTRTQNASLGPCSKLDPNQTTSRVRLLWVCEPNLGQLSQFKSVFCASLILFELRFLWYSSDFRFGHHLDWWPIFNVNFSYAYPELSLATTIQPTDKIVSDEFVSSSGSRGRLFEELPRASAIRTCRISMASKQLNDERYCNIHFCQCVTWIHVHHNQIDGYICEAHHLLRLALGARVLFLTSFLLNFRSLERGT